MDYLKKFQKKCLKRKNAKIFNTESDLYYVIKEIKIIYSEEEQEITTKSGDTIINVVTKPIVRTSFNIFTSTKSVFKTYPIKTDTLEIPIGPDVTMSNLGDSILEHLRTLFENSEITTVENDI